MTSKKKNLSDAFAYDDAFRTMEGECDDILIPFVNYIFDQNYTKKAKIKRLRNEQFIRGSGGKGRKRITDSHFEITENDVTKIYHIECESGIYDGSILVRFFEYDSQIAMTITDWDGYNLKVRFPNSGLLLLRDKEKAPDKAKIIIDTPEGSTSYSVNIIKVSDFNINEIFEKQLYFLIPFYIFNYEKQLKQIDRDARSTDSLAELYGEIVEKLNREHARGSLSEFSYSVIIDLITRVLNKLAGKQKNLQQKVSDTMGGKVLMDIPVIREYHRGLDEGIEQGRLLALVQMLARGGSEDDLRKFHDATDEEIALAKERLEQSKGSPSTITIG